MPILGTFLQADDFADQQVVPMLFYPLNPSAMTDGDQPGVLQPFRSDTDGNLLVAIGGAGGGPILLVDDTDNVAPVGTASRLPTVARMYVFDDDATEFNRARAGDDSLENAFTLGPNILATDPRPRLWQDTTSSWIRARANDNAQVFASAARTATLSSATFRNGNYRGAQFVIDVTAIAATPSVVFSIEAFDSLSGKFFSLLDSVAIVAVGTTILRVYPGLLAVANLVANDLLPYQWRVTATHADADSITYSVGANLML